MPAISIVATPHTTRLNANVVTMARSRCGSIALSGRPGSTIRST
jgi:hypothetical protein